MAALEDSSFGRLIGVLVSPGKTFRSIAERPTWGVALIVLLIAATAVGVLTSQRIDKEDMRRSVQEQMEKRQGGQATPEQIERGVEMGEKIGSVTRWLVPVFVLVIYLIVALLFLAALRFFAASQISYRTSLAVALHAYMPALVGSLLTLPLILNRKSITMKEAQGGNNILASNLGAFAPESMGPAARALLSSVDFFSLWTVCLMIIGYRIAAKVSTTAATAVVVTLWVLYIAFKVGMAALFQ
jgi:hypothetical protein